MSDDRASGGNAWPGDSEKNGRPAEVAAASRKAIDEAAPGGRFILSTGDPRGRDTPDANLWAMIETARTYGRHSPGMSDPIR